MSDRDKPSPQGEGNGDPGDSAPGYEPPKLIVLGTFHELTRQQLKISGNADFGTAFQPAPSQP